jgi:hypothetical protein
MNTALKVDVLRKKLWTDLERLAERLICAFDLKFSEMEEHLASTVLRWADFRLRYVEAYPRQVAFSNKFPKSTLPPCAKEGLLKLIERFQKGADVNPYQGRGLTMRNDTSGSARHARTDLLFADWGVLHFHLSDEAVPLGRYYCKPSDYLALCLVGSDVAAIIDVIRHPDRRGFADPGVFETIARSWPGYVEQFRAKAAIGAGRVLSGAERTALREGGVSSFIELDGSVYFPPGGGITSASTATRTTFFENKLHDYIDELARLIVAEGNQFATHPRVLESSEPQFSLELGASGLCILEATSRNCFFIARTGDSPASESWMVQFNEAFAPVWAIDALQARSSIADSWFTVGEAVVRS